MSDPRLRCVFCDAPWTETMIALYDAGTSGTPCACCAVIFPDFTDEAPVPPSASKEHIPLPDTLDCAACGKTLYRLMKE